MKKDHPILFSTPMIQAILEGRKTQTRRIIKQIPTHERYGKPIMDWPLSTVYEKSGEWFCQVQTDVDDFVSFPIKCPYGNVGDVLWVRETWKPRYVKGGLDGFQAHYPNVHPWIYAADGNDIPGYGSFKPSIHMPRVACRLRLEITNIRVERLHTISEDDAKAEGVRFTDFGLNQYGQQHRGYHVLDVTNPDQCLLTARSAFGNLWEKINGEESWTANPWVWVLEFKQIKQTA